MPHQRYILIETIISAVLNAIVGTLFVFLMFGGMPQIGLWGEAGLAFDLVPTVFMITLMTTIALTLITRSRIAAGKVARAAPVSGLPSNPIVRGLLFAVAAALTIAPVSAAILYAIWPVTGDWTFNTVLVFKIAYCALLGLLITPTIVRHALRSGNNSQAELDR